MMKIKVSDLIWYLTGVFLGFVSGFLSESYFRKHRYLYAVVSMCLLFSVLLSLSGCTGKNVEDEGEDVVQAAEILSQSENNLVTIESSGKEAASTERSEQTLPELPEQKEADDVQEPISDFITKLSDIYAEKDSMVVFRCYHPEATEYTWEVYDEGRWESAAESEIIPKVDELYRKTSTFMTSADKEKQIRCRISLAGGTSVLEEASLYLLPEKIRSISADSYTVKAGEYVDSLTVPVVVIFTDDREETITGLNGLYFWNTEEESIEQSSTETGGIKETVTMVSTASEYSYIEVGENQGRMRYQDQDIPVIIVGEDQTAPTIQDLTVSAYAISDGSSEPEPVTVTFLAEDDISLRAALEYAFLPAGTEPQETDWNREASFDVDIKQNGTWVAYCRDESGNITTREEEVIAIDNKAPVVKLQLENVSWCQENKIIVEAEDDSMVQYCYRCPSLRIDSGWISEKTYSVKENGMWIVQVKDEAGNVTEEEISIDNIDMEPPVIHGIRIKEKSGGEAKTDEE